jgi:glucose/arabinose dehydrogenase
MKLATAAAIAALAMTGAASAQTNIGSQAPVATANLPFTMTTVSTNLQLPWRIAFLPDGRMLITEKVGNLLLVDQKGAKVVVGNTPAVWWQGQGGMLGVYVSPTFATDSTIYLTYSEPEPGVDGAGLALAKAKLVHGMTGTNGWAKLEDLKVIWRDGGRGKGGQYGAALAFAPDGKSLFLTSGDRQRFTPAQDPNSPLGKILHLTLDGKPAADNPGRGKTGGKSLPIFDPPSDTEKAKTTPALRTYTFKGPNLTPAEVWSTGHRTPYGLAFAPDGGLWEVEHGPKGGDELNLIEKGKNYGWPLVSYSTNYNDVPIPSPDTRADLEKPKLYWNPVVAPGGITFYKGAMFPQWNGSALLGGMGTKTLNRIVINGSNATSAERFLIDKRIRDVAVAPDGAIWLIEDANPGALIRVTPK